MAKMSESEILQERQEILSQLDPNLVRSLLKRSNKKSKMNVVNNMQLVTIMIIMNMPKDIMDGSVE